MLKKVLGSIMIMIMIFSVSSYATDVSEGEAPKENPGQATEEPNKPTEKEPDQKEEEKNNTNTNATKPNKNNSNKNTTKTTTSNKPVETKIKSKEAGLKELKVDVEGITPEFDKDVTEYYLAVDLEVEKIKVTATPIDNAATVIVLGNTNLKAGKNTITINVKAEDGTVKKYYIYVTKSENIEKANAQLKSLKVKDFDLSPNFQSDIDTYHLNIQEEIDKIEIIAEPEMEKATVNISGNTNLKEGDNLIKIEVTAEDGETIKTYKINAYISEKKVKIIKEESKLPAIIALIILGGCIISLATVVIFKKRK